MTNTYTKVLKSINMPDSNLWPSNVNMTEQHLNMSDPNVLEYDWFFKQQNNMPNTNMRPLNVSMLQQNL